MDGINKLDAERVTLYDVGTNFHFIVAIYSCAVTVDDPIPNACARQTTTHSAVW